MPRVAVPEMQRPLVGWRRACAHLGVGERHLRQLVRSGDLPVVKVGKRRYLFDPADLSRWIDQHRMFFYTRAEPR